jgi:SAM-dependent methyltransferase
MAHRHQDWGLLAGFDFSTGMAAKAARSAGGLPVHFFVADAQAVPFPDRTFDVVMARHMLYHVPDIERAVAEAARVLCPGGYLMAVTNSADNMPQYAALRRRAAARFPAMTKPKTYVGRFALENGPDYLQRHLKRVETHVLPGTLRFPTSQPFVDYFASSRALAMRPGHTDAEWQAVLDFVQDEVEAVIAREGHFDVTKTTGAIVGVKGG